MDNGVPIDSVGGSAQEEPVNLENTEEHDASSLLQTDSFLQILQATPLKAVVRLHTHTECQQLARNQGWTVKKASTKKNCLKEIA
jgi:hypothetical protein